MAELRQDFRRYYGCRYDDVAVDEAIDLIRGLPDGSAWVARTFPLREWSEEHHRDADLLDAVEFLVWYIAMDKQKVPSPTRVVRPGDAIARRLEDERKRRVKSSVESDSWEEM